ncbi:hypothetical protein H4Q26_009428, partial [Puccinia striiformis f. sp. tritici PST-130]
MPRLTPNHTQSVSTRRLRPFPSYLAILLTFHRSEYCLLPTWVAKTFRQFQKRQHAAEAANVAVKQAANKAKQQDLGLVRFIGELDKLNMFTERIIHKCIKKLRSNIDAPEEEDIESLSRLMMTDDIDTCSHKWLGCNVATGPELISQIHKE